MGSLQYAGQYISIHALREEGDRMTGAIFSEQLVFLSTPSARRATVDLSVPYKDYTNFYPRPPRGGRLCR